MPFNHVASVCGFPPGPILNLGSQPQAEGLSNYQGRSGPAVSPRHTHSFSGSFFLLCLISSK